VVKDNLIYDPREMTGIVLTEFGENGSTLDSALVQGNVVVRGGGNAYNQQQPAFSVGRKAPAGPTSPRGRHFQHHH